LRKYWSILILFNDNIDLFDKTLEKKSLQRGSGNQNEGFYATISSLDRPYPH
jgi:hypothetical protein